LERGGRGGRQPSRWFRQGLEGFAERTQRNAVAVLESLAGRLELLEEELTPTADGDAAAATPRPSREEIKGLLRPDPEEADAPLHEKPKAREQRPKENRPADKDHNQDGKEKGQRLQRRGETAVLSPVSGDLGTTGWLILLGLLLAVLAAAVVLWWRRREPRTPPVKSPAGAKAEEQGPLPAPHERTPADLYQEAEQLARAGQFKEAVRSLYWSVLSLLHRQQLLRYETTRTNGEYVQEVCLATQAPAGLDEPFAQLTDLFDLAWYGDQGCTLAEYGTCRELGDDIRALVSS
jgi:hypothetical protein